MTSLHSVVPPSSSGDWSECPGMISLGRRFPRLYEDPSAAEGEAAHWVAYSMAKTHTPAVGDVAPNGQVVTEEMIDGALLYFNSVFRVANPHSAFSQVQWEVRRAIARIHPEMFGTPDASLNLIHVNGELHLWDFKFGHLAVSEYQNYQLACYTRGILDELGYNGEDEQHITVVFHIVQPRCYTAGPREREWRCKASDLRAIWNIVSAAAHNALSEHPTFKTGPQCTYCDGRRACPTLMRNAGAAMDFAATSMPQELDGTALGRELAQTERLLHLLTSKFSALREQGEAMMAAGRIVPGYGMVSGRSSKVWTESVDMVAALGDILSEPGRPKIDLRKPAALITVNQAEELLQKNGIDPAVIAAYSKPIPGAKKFEAVPAETVARVFSQTN